jgi:hypothetical protein
VQGLELDLKKNHAGCRLTIVGSDLSSHSFRGVKWTDVKKPEPLRYLKTASRVLLTRARQGMVIFLPPGAKRARIRHLSSITARLPPLGASE